MYSTPMPEPEREMAAERGEILIKLHAMDYSNIGMYTIDAIVNLVACAEKHGQDGGQMLGEAAQKLGFKQSDLWL
jgi:hypothetical protein